MRLSALVPPLLLCLAEAPAQTPTADAAVGTVVGSVTVEVGKRAERPPRYYRGPYRAAHGRRELPSPEQSVVVYVEDLPAPEAGWPVPAEPAALRQHHDRFIPHVLPVIAGATVTFPNDDDYYHNVFSVVAGDRFDLGRYGRGDTRLQTFPEPAVVVVRCEIHPTMKAYILVRDNPHFTVPGRHGRFELSGVPAGTWSIAAWHPTRGLARHTVAVPASGPATIDFSF